MAAVRIREIVIIGAGRLAAQLGLTLVKRGMKVVQVYNRTQANGQKLASLTGATYTDDIHKITLKADLYFFAVSDSVIGELSSVLRLNNKLAVHASGTMGMEILAPVSSNIGVFYPVQTFPQNKRIDFRTVPVCIEANSPASAERLMELAKAISNHAYYLDSDKRRMLHLGAVFVSNFTNFLYAITEDVLLSHDVPFGLLIPLIRQTALNARKGNLVRSQTGPAARGDIKVIEKHLELLADRKDYQEIYRLISDNIIKHKYLHGKL